MSRESNLIKKKLNIDIEGLSNLEIYNKIYGVLKNDSINTNISSSYIQNIVINLKNEEKFSSLKKYDTIETTYSKFQSILDEYFLLNEPITGSIPMFRHYINKYNCFFNEIVLKFKNDTEEALLSSGMLFKIKNFKEGFLIEHYNYETGSPIKFVLSYILTKDIKVFLINKKNFNISNTNKNEFINFKKQKEDLLKDSERSLYQILLFLCYISKKLENSIESTSQIESIYNREVLNKMTSSGNKSNKHTYKLSDLVTVRVYKKNKNVILSRNHWRNREHSVRGFERHYKSGKVVWIKPHVRGSNVYGEKISKHIVLN